VENRRGPSRGSSYDTAAGLYVPPASNIDGLPVKALDSAVVGSLYTKLLRSRRLQFPLLNTASQGHLSRYRSRLLLS
jgi:hypothetical protein